MTTKTSTSQSGFTLLELLLVIGVAALLLIGGIATYRLVSDGNKATESTRLLLTLRQEAQTLAQQQGGNYGGISFRSGDSSNNASPLVTSGVLRANQRNPFNGAIIITPLNDPAFDQLSIEFQNVSQSGCIKLIQAINNANEVIQVGTASANYTAAGGQFPVTAVQASAACNQSVNAITWVLP